MLPLMSSCLQSGLKLRASAFAAHSASTGLSFLRSLSLSAASQAAREQLSYDVAIIGGGPAGFAAAIRLKQQCKEQDKQLSVCVLEKGSSVGAHILSGCAFEPRALDELLPDWKEDPDVPIKVPVTKDSLVVLSASGSTRIPFAPKSNKGSYIVSLSEVVRWMGAKAEALGVDVFPGFAASHLLYDGQGAVAGVGTADAGINKNGEKKPGIYTSGVDLKARVTLLAEGARGSLTQEAMRKFRLRERGMHPAGAEPQSYALGVKEVWEVPESVHKQGTVVHTLGYPMDHATFGGGFIYHMANRRVALGFVTGLDYGNPYLSPHQEFNRWKLHPLIRAHIEGGTCLQYGARVLNEGGFQAIPKLSFLGGALVGCSAGFLNVPKIKGTHTAMLSGMYGGEAAFRALTHEPQASTPGPRDLTTYESAMKASWVWEELQHARNMRPGFQWGLFPGLVHAAIDRYLLRGKAWWTLHNRRHDHEATKYARDCQPIDYPKPDGKLTFDLATSLSRSGTNHDHDQPSHLKLKDPSAPEWHNGPQYASMESRYCPAGVYEYAKDKNGRTKLQINAQNCLHCKACDIKDPLQNIKWTCPEGGGGPNYSIM